MKVMKMLQHMQPWQFSGKQQKRFVNMKTVSLVTDEHFKTVVLFSQETGLEIFSLPELKAWG